MPELFQERRRFPRATVAAGHELRMPLQMTVQLMDMSATGVLVVGPQPLEVGAHARLQVRLGTEPVEMNLTVTRVVPDGPAGAPPVRYRMGAAVVALDDEDRRVVQRFLKGDEV